MTRGTPKGKTKSKRPVRPSKSSYNKAGPVTIKKIDPETGEIIVKVEEPYTQDEFHDIMRKARGD